jgi:hypothetical protein
VICVDWLRGIPYALVLFCISLSRLHLGAGLDREHEKCVHSASEVFIAIIFNCDILRLLFCSCFIIILILFFVLIQWNVKDQLYIWFVVCRTNCNWQIRMNRKKCFAFLHQIVIISENTHECRYTSGLRCVREIQKSKPFFWWIMCTTTM